MSDDAFGTWRDRGGWREWAPDLIAIARRTPKGLTRPIHAATPELAATLARRAGAGQVVWDFTEESP